MKTKRKIDKKAIQQFFIDHTEKIVIGLVGLLFLYFAYNAVTLQVNDSYKPTPETLKQLTASAQGRNDATVPRGTRRRNSRSLLMRKKSKSSNGPSIRSLTTGTGFSR